MYNKKNYATSKSGTLTLDSARQASRVPSRLTIRYIEEICENNQHCDPKDAPQSALLPLRLYIWLSDERPNRPYQDTETSVCVALAKETLLKMEQSCTAILKVL